MSTAGGASLVVMRGPDGQEFPNHGVYLEVVPNEHIVATDAYTRAWEPSAKPFVTVILTFEDLGGGKTRYTARARHWTPGRPRDAREGGLHRRLGPVHQPTGRTGGHAAKYLCLVYHDAAHWDACSLRG
jgi:uncharacterized protein YndB with AHSA1/START domain